MSNDDEPFDTETYRYSDPDVHGSPDTTGLDDLGLMMPVTSKDARQEVGANIVGVLVGDELAQEFDITPGKIYWSMSFDHTTPVPTRRIDDVHDDIMHTVLDDYRDHFTELVDNVELEPGEAAYIGDTDLVWKRGDQWYLFQWNTAIYDEVATIETRE